MIGNTIPLICGGHPATDSCYIIGNGNETAVKMFERREDAASIVINETLLWVTGGSNGDESLMSTEFIELHGGSGSTSPGPDMPIALDGHSMVSLNSTTAMVIGGYSNGWSSKTFYFDLNSSFWTNGPELKSPREYHASAILTDSVTNIKYVIVAGGYKSDYLSSVEVLEFSSSAQEWTQGKFCSFVFAIKISIQYVFWMIFIA